MPQVWRFAGPAPMRTSDVPAELVDVEPVRAPAARDAVGPEPQVLDGAREAHIQVSRRQPAPAFGRCNNVQPLAGDQSLGDAVDAQAAWRAAGNTHRMTAVRRIR